MKHYLLAIALICLGSQAHATWIGKLDLSPSVAPIVIREAHDGQWLAGVTKENLWHLDYKSDTGSFWDGQRFHGGVFQAWNAEHGNASFGMVAGIDLPAGLGAGVQKLAAAFGLDQTTKPFMQYVSAAVSLDGVGGYRPVHTADVHSWIYGGGVRLNIAFGVSELKKGL